MQPHTGCYAGYSTTSAFAQHGRRAPPLVTSGSGAAQRRVSQYRRRAGELPQAVTTPACTAQNKIDVTSASQQGKSPLRTASRYRILSQGCPPVSRVGQAAQTRLKCSANAQCSRCWAMTGTGGSPSAQIAIILLAEPQRNETNPCARPDVTCAISQPERQRNGSCSFRLSCFVSKADAPRLAGNVTRPRRTVAPAPEAFAAARTRVLLRLDIGPADAPPITIDGFEQSRSKDAPQLACKRYLTMQWGDAPPHPHGTSASRPDTITCAARLTVVAAAGTHGAAT